MFIDFAWILPTLTTASGDGVSLNISAVVHLRMVESKLAIGRISDYLDDSRQWTQKAFELVLGRHQLSHILADRESLCKVIQEILETHSEAWNMKVSRVEILLIDLSGNVTSPLPTQTTAKKLCGLRKRGTRSGLPISERLSRAAEKFTHESC